MKKALFAVAVVALLAVVAQAGEIKYHDWPTQKVAQELATIPVTIDIGYWVRIREQDKLGIKLTQVSINDYRGCTNVNIETNTQIRVTASIAHGGPGAISVQGPGTGLSVGFGEGMAGNVTLDRPGGTAQVCVRLTNPDLSKVPGGTKNQRVATVTLRVVPTS